MDKKTTSALKITGALQREKNAIELAVEKREEPSPQEGPWKDTKWSQAFQSRPQKDEADSRKQAMQYWSTKVKYNRIPSQATSLVR